jgi:dihydrofolate reductase
MRNLVVTEFISLDGVVEAPGGEPTHPHTGWTMAYGSPELYEEKFRETMEAESLLLGRVTFEGFAEAWPERDGPFAQKMNAMPKHVVASGSGELGWNATRLSGDVGSAVTELKAGDGGPILVVGSATLVQALLRERLVDELRLMTYPVVLGGGGSIFSDDRVRLDFALAERRAYADGVELRVLRPRAAPVDGELPDL